MTQEEYMTFATELAEKIGMPEEAMANVKAEADEIFASDDLQRRVELLRYQLYDDSVNVNKKIDAFLDETGKDRLTFNIFFCFYSAIKAKKVFEKNGWDIETYYDTMLDVVIWAKVCHAKYGIWGIENLGWVGNSLNVKIVRLGRLQFHKITYDRPDYEHAGVKVKAGDKVINIHIPEGDALTKEKRIASYKKAYKHFGCTGKAVFVCDSWLFYEKHREFLNPNSNIISFMNDFHFVEFNESHRLDDMWRVFGFHVDYADFKNLPRNTSMQRAYADWLAEHGTTGCGYGVMIFDGEKIL